MQARDVNLSSRVTCKDTIANIFFFDDRRVFNKLHCGLLNNYSKLLHKFTTSSGLFFGHSKKTQGVKNSKLKQKTQTQAKNSTFRHFSEKSDFLIAKNWPIFRYQHTN